MSRREDIDNAIWSAPDFEALSLEATVFYLWSFTNPRCGMAGLYKVSRRAMGESKVPDDRLDSTTAELAAAEFLFYEEDVLFVRTRVRHLRQKTVQIAKSIRADVAKIPAAHPLRMKFLKQYSTAPWLREYLSDESLATVTEGSHEGQETSDPNSKSVTLKGRSTDRPWKRQRQGKGQGPSREGSGEGTDWQAWASENLPDLPSMLVAMSAAKLASANADLPPEKVRRHVLAAYPHLAEEAAA